MNLSDIPAASTPLICTPPNAPPSKPQDKKDLLNGRHPHVVAEWNRITRSDCEHLILPTITATARMKRMSERDAETKGLIINPWKGIDTTDHNAVRNAVQDYGLRLTEWAKWIYPDWIFVNDETTVYSESTAADMLYRANLLWVMFKGHYPDVPVYWYNHMQQRAEEGYVFSRTHPLTPSEARGCSLYVTSIEQAVSIWGTTAMDAAGLPLAWVSMTDAFMWERPWFTGGWKESVPYTGEWGRRLMWQMGQKYRGCLIGISQPHLLEPRFAVNLHAFICGFNNDAFPE